MIKKLLIIIIVFIFLINGLNAVSVTNYNNEILMQEYIDFSKPQIDYSTHFGNILISNTNSVIIKPNQPILPIYKKTYTYPLNTNIKIIDFKITSEIYKEKLQEKLQYSQTPLPPGNKQYNDEDITHFNLDHNSNEIYPDLWFDYDVSSGISNGEKNIFLNIIIYPVRYFQDYIYYISSCKLKILIEKSNELSLSNDNIDMILIGPGEFSEEIIQYIDHKESNGLKTRFISLESIYDGTYFQTEGRDDAEKVKYFIKNAYENWNISYVLLVGGRKPGIFEEWYTPVRYVHVFWADETRYMSDLYYADIFDKNHDFSTWDSDNNDVFSEWPENGLLKDEIDLYPEIYVGRWPCRNLLELKIIIEKTIEYENMQLNKKIVLVGGDNFEQPGIEGEIVCDKSLEYLTEFDYEKVYASEMEVSPKNMRNALGNGAIFMHMHGHGSPVKWGTHYPDRFDEWMDGLYITDVPWFFNDEYPILILGGCHTAMFNVSLFNRPWIYGYRLTPEGLGWWFARKIGGGGIATLGYTCFPVASPGEDGDLDGDGNNEPDCVESGYGFIQLKILEAYGNEGMKTLGECWGFAINQYLNAFKIPSERWHLHTCEGFVILGDPSLRIGGYN